MPMVDLSVAGRHHAVHCDDGEENRLKRLAAYLDQKASDLQRRHPELTESRLLLLASLLLTDELFDAYDEIQQVRARLNEASRASESEAAQAVERIATRLERLAASLETT